MRSGTGEFVLWKVKNLRYLGNVIEKLVATECFDDPKEECKRGNRHVFFWVDKFVS